MRRPGPFDPKTGKIHVLSEKCSTCVFRPGNLMRLEPGRVKDLLDANKDGALTCHQTLDYAPGDAEAAVCRGFFDHPVGESSIPLRMAKAMDAVEYDEPPKKED